jgi:hypothetical protein
MLWSSALGRSAHKNSHKIYFVFFLMFIQILEIYTNFWNFNWIIDFKKRKAINSDGPSFSPRPQGPSPAHRLNLPGSGHTAWCGVCSGPVIVLGPAMVARLPQAIRTTRSSAVAGASFRGWRLTMRTGQCIFECEFAQMCWMPLHLIRISLLILKTNVMWCTLAGRFGRKRKHI